MARANPSLVWLATVDGASLRTDLDLAVKTLMAVRTGDLEADDRYWPQAARRVLVACVEAGPGQLSASDSQKLLFPLLLVLGDQGRFNEFAPQLSVLSRRRDVWGSSALCVVQKRFPALPEAIRQQEMSPSHRQPKDPTMTDVWQHNQSSAEAIRLAGRLPRDLPPLADAAMLGRALCPAADVWGSRRRLLESDERAVGDVWLMRAMTLAGVLFPPPLAEAIYLDEEVWQSRAMAEFADGLVHPLQEHEVGLSAAALLNSRIRILKPRLFLRFPETLVVEAIGQRSDTSPRLMREAVESVAGPLLRTAEAIDEEISRPNFLPPRKRSLSAIREHLSQALGSLDYRIIGVGGETVAFDPAQHISFSQVEAGDPVVVIRPGLQSISDGRISVKTQVSPPAAEGRSAENNEETP